MDLKGESVHSWASEVGQPTDDDRYVSSYMFGWQHVEPSRDGSVFAIVSRGALLKLDWDSNLEWKADLPLHHDLSIAPSGMIVGISSRPRIIQIEGRPSRVILEDSLTFIDSSGAVRMEISIFDLFFARPELRKLLVAMLDKRFAKLEQLGLHGLIDKHGKTKEWTSDAIKDATKILETGVSNLGPRSETTLLRRIPKSPSDLFHTNTVEFLTQSVPGLWEAGDILISIRNLDLIAVLSVNPPKLKWSWGRGKISRQHQPTLLPNGNLLIYDNGIAKQQSRIVELDPVSRSIAWESSVPFFNDSAGGSEKLPNGNILVTDTAKGHVFELDRDENLVWDFWNPIVTENKGKLQRRTLYRMSRLECDFFAQSRGPNPSVQCAD
jgi:hypothetical protein